MAEYLTADRLLVFVSFKEVVQQGYFSIDNFFLDQRGVLCYLSPYTSLKLMMLGLVSFEQILLVYCLKSDNTFTQFYLMGVAWADSEMYHLDPVVVAQQIRCWSLLWCHY